jgi:hypothetical protein
MILKTAKARACLRRRDYVIPDDVKYVCRLALRHRLLPSPEYAEDSLGIDTLIERLIAQVAVPLMQGKGRDNGTPLARLLMVAAAAACAYGYFYASLFPRSWEHRAFVPAL